MRAFLFAACAFFFAAFYADPDVLLTETRRLLFKLDPRFYGTEVSAALWLAVGWALADFAARVLWRKRVGAAQTRLNPRVWNAASASLYLLALIILGHFLRWDYEPVLRSAFQPQNYSAPGVMDYISGKRIFETNADGTVRYGVLGLFCVAALAYGIAWSLVDRARDALALRRKGADSARPERQARTNALAAAFARPYTALAAVLVCFDASFCAVSFLKWAVFHYWYIPMSDFLSFHEITREGAIALATAALCAAGAVLRSRRVRRAHK